MFGYSEIVKTMADAIEKAQEVLAENTDNIPLCSTTSHYLIRALILENKQDEARKEMRKFVTEYISWSYPSEALKKMFFTLYKKKNFDINKLVVSSKEDRIKFMDDLEKGWRNSGDDDNKGHGNDPDKVDPDNPGKSGEKQKNK